MCDMRTTCIPPFSFLIMYHEITLTGAISRAGTAYPSGVHEITPVFSGERIIRSVV